MTPLETRRLQQDQITHLERMDSATIPRGAEVPIPLLKFFLPYGSSLAEFGGGVGVKALALLDWFKIQNFDINKGALKTSTGLGISSCVADVSKSVPLVPDVYDGVLMEGLLCNTIGENVKKVVKNALRILKPNGYLFIADILTTDIFNPELRELMGNYPYFEWDEKWQKRYAANKEIGIPQNHFIVMAKKDGVGQLKELGCPAELKELVDSNQIERFARHFSLEELDDLRSTGFREISFQQTIWFSRTNKPLSGFIAVWQKPKENVA